MTHNYQSNLYARILIELYGAVMTKMENLNKNANILLILDLFLDFSLAGLFLANILVWQRPVYHAIIALDNLLKGVN